MSWEERLFLNQIFIFILETKFIKLIKHILEMNLHISGLWPIGMCLYFYI